MHLGSYIRLLSGYTGNATQSTCGEDTWLSLDNALIAAGWAVE
jgi:hypothetical protein